MCGFGCCLLKCYFRFLRAMPVSCYEPMNIWLNKTMADRDIKSAFRVTVTVLQLIGHCQCNLYKAHLPVSWLSFQQFSHASDIYTLVSFQLCVAKLCVILPCSRKRSLQLMTGSQTWLDYLGSKDQSPVLAPRGMSFRWILPVLQWQLVWLI